MDEQTLENLEMLGIPVTNNNPTPAPMPTPEQVKQVIDDAKKQIPPPADTIGNDEGAKPNVPDTTPEINQPEVATDPAVAPISEVTPTEPEESTDEASLDDVLNTLEELSKDTLDDIAKSATPTDKKIKKITVPDVGMTKEQNKTIQEIVDLNVKLQNDLSVKNISETAKDQKIKELQEKLSSMELDDSKEEVLSEVKWINKYYKQFKSTNNETFKVKATQEALDMIEQMRWSPLNWDYLGDRIEEQLKVVERMTQKSSDDHERETNPEPIDPNKDYIMAHGIGL